MDMRKMLQLEQYKMFSGDTVYVYDVKDGDAELELHVYADEEVSVWLIIKKKDGTPLAVPYSVGRQVHSNTKVYGLQSVEVRTPSKKTTVCMCVMHRLINTKDPLDLTPVEIVPPPPNEMRLAQFISREVAKRMGANFDDITVDEDDDLEADLPEDEFDYMDTEQEATVIDRRAAAAADRAQRKRRRADPPQDDDGGGRRRHKVTSDEDGLDDDTGDRPRRSRGQQDRGRAPRDAERPVEGPRRRRVKDDREYRQGEGYGDDERD